MGRRLSYSQSFDQRYVQIYNYSTSHTFFKCYYDYFMPLRDFPWELGKELECNNIDSYRYIRKGSLLIQTLYLWARDREIGKNRRFHMVLLIEIFLITKFIIDIF